MWTRSHNNNNNNTASSQYRHCEHPSRVRQRGSVTTSTSKKSTSCGSLSSHDEAAISLASNCTSSGWSFASHPILVDPSDDYHKDSLPRNERVRPGAHSTFPSTSKTLGMTSLDHLPRPPAYHGISNHLYDTTDHFLVDNVVREKQPLRHNLYHETISNPHSLDTHDAANIIINSHQWMWMNDSNRHPTVSHSWENQSQASESHTSINADSITSNSTWQEEAHWLSFHTAVHQFMRPRVWKSPPRRRLSHRNHPVISSLLSPMTNGYNNDSDKEDYDSDDLLESLLPEPLAMVAPSPLPPTPAPPRAVSPCSSLSHSIAQAKKQLFSSPVSVSTPTTTQCTPSPLPTAATMPSPRAMSPDTTTVQATTTVVAVDKVEPNLPTASTHNPSPPALSLLQSSSNSHSPSRRSSTSSSSNSAVFVTVQSSDKSNSSRSSGNSSSHHSVTSTIPRLSAVAAASNDSIYANSRPKPSLAAEYTHLSSQLAELRMRLALAEAERDELEFAMLNRHRS
jgi:hypothetical protein